jgi:hypothetical protein
LVYYLTKKSINQGKNTFLTKFAYYNIDFKSIPKEKDIIKCAFLIIATATQTAQTTARIETAVTAKTEL